MTQVFIVAKSQDLSPSSKVFCLPKYVTYFSKISSEFGSTVIGISTIYLVPVIFYENKDVFFSPFFPHTLFVKAN